MVGLELLAHRAHDAQRGVVVAGGHQHVVLLGEYAVEIVLCGGLAETSRDAYDLEPGHRGEYLLRFAVVAAHDIFLYGLVYHVRRKHQHGQRQQSQRYGRHIVRNVDERQDDGREGYDCRRREESLYAHRVGERFLVLDLELLPREVEHEDYGQTRNVVRKDPAGDGQRGDDGGPLRLVGLEQPAAVARETVGVLLIHHDVVSQHGEPQRGVGRKKYQYEDFVHCLLGFIRFGGGGCILRVMVYEKTLRDAQEEVRTMTTPASGIRLSMRRASATGVAVSRSPQKSSVGAFI